MHLQTSHFPINVSAQLLWLLIIPALVFAVYQALRRPLRAYFVQTYTAVDGLPALGLKRATKIQGTAVVCGGSIAGLLAARVCSDHFAHVLLVDPELDEVERSKPSSRIAQYDSLHGYLTFMLDGLRRLWPTVDAELNQTGGYIASGDVKPCFGGSILAAPHEEYEAKSQKLPETLFVRRPKLENLLRRLLLGTPSGVRTLPGTVRGVCVRGEDLCTPQVASVVIRGANGEEMRIHEPALVIDCTGDSQAGHKWLKKTGYDAPRVEYDQKLYYVTITFAVSCATKGSLPIPGGYDNAGWIYTFVPDSDVCNAGFVLGKMDNDIIQLCCGGWGDVALPLHESEIETFVRSCTGIEPVPEWVIDILNMLTAEGTPTFKPLRIRPCSYIRYQDASALPSNFIALGDSMIQLNPIYAQGCSKAMMSAVALNSLLWHTVPTRTGPGKEGLPDDFATTYFQHVGGHGDALWESTKTFDYGFASTRPAAGETLRTGVFARWYLAQFISAALQDERAASVLWHVRMLLAPPTDMFAPSVVWRVARHGVGSVLDRLWYRV